MATVEDLYKNFSILAESKDPGSVCIYYRSCYLVILCFLEVYSTKKCDTNADT